MTYYKILNNGKSPYANFDYTEYLPKNGKPGKWLPKFDKLELCKSGYHVTDAEHLIDWIDGNQLFEVEVEGKALKGDNKTTCQKIRFVRQVEGWNDKKVTDYGKELRQSYKYDKTCSTCRYLDENRDCVLGIRCVNYTLWQGKIL